MSTFKFGWIRVTKTLPAPGELVLVLRDKKYRGGDRRATGYWIDRDDLPAGRMWDINGASGGIGTDIEVRPPVAWQPLPPPRLR